MGDQTDDTGSDLPEPDRAALDRVVAATVDIISTGGGRGVLVAGGYILTAAHCIEWTTGGGAMAGFTSDDFRVRVKTAAGRELQLSVHAVEACADIAVLGAVDNQRSPAQAEEFESFCEQTPAVPLWRGEPVPFEGHVDTWTYNLDRSWVRGYGEVFRPGQPAMSVTTDTRIHGGASGGPIVTAGGELAALVSFVMEDESDDAEGPFDGQGPRPLRALPAWLVEKLTADDPFPV